MNNYTIIQAYKTISNHTHVYKSTVNETNRVTYIPIYNYKIYKYNRRQLYTYTQVQVHT